MSTTERLHAKLVRKKIIRMRPPSTDSQTKIKSPNSLSSEADLISKRQSGDHSPKGDPPLEMDEADQLSNKDVDTSATTEERTESIPVGFVMGRSFENAMGDSSLKQQLTKLSNLFKRPMAVLKSPVKTGVLLNYLLNMNRNTSPVLFYITCQLYEREMASNKELAKDFKRVSYEIYSTFLHPNSPLHVNIDPVISQAIYDNLEKGICEGAFTKAMEPSLNLVQLLLDAISADIMHGLDTWGPPEQINLFVQRPGKEQLQIFEICLLNHLNTLNEQVIVPADGKKRSTSSLRASTDCVTLALITSLVSVHRYYCLTVCTKENESFKPRGSVFTRGVENSSIHGMNKGGSNINLSSFSSQLWTTIPGFCMKFKKNSHLFRSRTMKLTLKQHNLHERTAINVEFCTICGHLICGLAPQGFFCTNCSLIVHLRCKDIITQVCSKDKRKSTVSSNLAPTAEENSSIVYQEEHELQSQNPHINITSSPAFHSSTTSLRETGDINLQIKGKHRLSISAEGLMTNANQENDDSNSPTTNQTGTNRRFTSDSHMVGHSMPSTPIGDTFQALVQNDWADDPEMVAGASFDAELELKRQFPKYQIPAKSHKNEEHVRMLVMLEFHQKIMFMVAYLKIYSYLWIRHWPKQHETLAQILCLDRIPELIELFRSLVQCINATKGEQGYLEIAEAVRDWLKQDDCANLKSWSRHCQALACTNILDEVRLQVRNYARRYPEVEPLLQTKHKKNVLLEGLRQMRILYFNLPMIVSNIIKDLEKKAKSYKLEAKIWKEVNQLLSSLPQAIDDVCMPLVKRINDGQLTSTLDRKEVTIFRPQYASLQSIQRLIVNFPFVIFNYWVMAAAEVVVDKLTVLSEGMINHDYIREPTDMLAILLKDMLILAIRDGDRHVLRPVKAFRDLAAERSNADRLSQSRVSTSSSIHSTTSQTSTSNPSQADSSTASGSYTSTSATSLVGLKVSTNVTTTADRTSAVTRLAPLFPLQDMFTSMGEKSGTKGNLLNIVFMDPTVLVRILFSSESERLRWFDILKEKNSTSQKMTPKKSKPEPSPLFAEMESSKSIIDVAEPGATDESGKEKNDFTNALDMDRNLKTLTDTYQLTLAEFNRLSKHLRNTISEVCQKEYEQQINESCSREHKQNWVDLVLLQSDLMRQFFDFLSNTAPAVLNEKFSKQGTFSKHKISSNTNVVSEGNLCKAKSSSTESCPSALASMTELEGHLPSIQRSSLKNVSQAALKSSNVQPIISDRRGAIRRRITFDTPRSIKNDHIQTIFSKASSPVDESKDQLHLESALFSQAETFSQRFSDFLQVLRDINETNKLASHCTEDPEKILEQRTELIEQDPDKVVGEAIPDNELEQIARKLVAELLEKAKDQIEVNDTDRTPTEAGSYFSESDDRKTYSESQLPSAAHLDISCNDDLTDVSFEEHTLTEKVSGKSSTSVDRTDSQKSTASSGFVGSGEE